MADWGVELSSYKKHFQNDTNPELCQLQERLSAAESRLNTLEIDYQVLETLNDQLKGSHTQLTREHNGCKQFKADLRKENNKLSTNAAMYQKVKLFSIIRRLRSFST